MKNTKLRRILAGVLALVMLLGAAPIALAATGTTTGEPFPKGTGGSNSFRIPALVTLSDGTLVAAADARWNSTLDNGGIDTIVSVSKDGGDNWSYTFANYLGDNGNTYDNTSTCFIDPALAVKTIDGVDTIFMLVDLYPYGVAIANTAAHTAEKTVGFNSDGKLLLSADNHNTYGYYLDKNTDGTYTIYSSGGTKVDGYTVDAYFNITGNDGTSSNLFFSDSPYKVVRTGYLYLTQSTDGGESWSAPTLIPGVKTADEYSCLVGPGRGLVTSSGRIIFPVYKYAGSTEGQVTSFIYSDDNGASWTRSASCGVSWSSEAAVVELADRTLRFFYRSDNSCLSYVDYANGAWGSGTTLSDIPTNSDTQLSAITYSKTIGGKQVILVSCPTGPNEAGSNNNDGSARLNGKIFAFTVESDNSLTKVGSVSVTSDDAPFMYSCLTELSDGTVAILYEDLQNGWGGGSDDYYFTMDYKEYNLTTAMGLTFDTEDDSTAVNITMAVGDSVTHTLPGSFIEHTNSSYTVARCDLSTMSSSSGLTSGSSYYIGDGTNWITYADRNIQNTTNLSEATRWSYDGNGLYITSDSSKLYLNSDLGAAANDSSTTWSVDGTYGLYYTNTYSYRYLAFDGTKWTTVSPSGAESCATAAVYAVTDTSTAGAEEALSLMSAASTVTAVTISAESAGSTQITVGGTTYSVTVSAADGADNTDVTITETVNVRIKVEGTSETYTDDSGNYENNIAVSPNTSVATMAVTGSSAYATATLGTDSKFTGGTINLSSCLYKFTASGSGFVVESVSEPGTYLNITAHSAGYPQSTTSAVMTLSTGSESGSFYIYDTNGSYLHFYRNGNNRFDRVNTTKDFEEECSFLLYRLAADGETSSTEIPGYVQVTSLNDITEGEYLIVALCSGSYYVLHPSTSTSNKYAHVAKVTGETAGGTSTDITFTGVAVGTTTAVVGTTQYNITVYDDVEIDINYVCDGEVVATGTVTAASDAAEYTISPTTFLHDGVVYIVETPTFALTGEDSYTVTVKKAELSDLGGSDTGIVGGTDIDGTDSQGKSITKITITEGLSYDLDCDTSYSSVSWSSADESIATVDANGTVTAKEEGVTVVTAIYYNEDGVAVAADTVIVNVIPGYPNSTYTRTVAFYTQDLINSSLYYSLNAGDLIKLEIGELFYGVFPKDSASNQGEDTIQYTSSLAFFALPHDGYIVTYMSFTGTAGSFLSLSPNGEDVGDGSAYYYDSTATSGGAYWQAVGLCGNYLASDTSDTAIAALAAGRTTVKNLVKAAIDIGCTVGSGMTRRQAEGDLASNLTCVAQKAPDLAKEIYSVTSDGTSTAYTPDMQIGLGDTISYQITVYVPTVNADYGTISYYDISLKDTTLGQTLLSSSSTFGTASGTVDSYTYIDSSNNVQTYNGEATVYTYTVDLTLTHINYNDLVNYGTVTNNAALEYTYTTQYGSSSATDSSATTAKLTLYLEPVFVLDFGLPLSFTITDAELEKIGVDIAGGVTIRETESDNGVATTGFTYSESDKAYTITYTPTAVLHGTDILKLTDSANHTFGYCQMIPASNVLYEESFMERSGTGAAWELTGDADVDREQSNLNAAPYGYDTAYDSSTGASGKQYVATLTSANRFSNNLTFSFTGTGFDLIGTCGPNTGTLLVRVDKIVDGIATYHQGYLVDTAFKDGTYGTIYQVPIVHAVCGEEPAEYKVTVSGAYVVYNNTSANTSANTSSLALGSVLNSDLRTLMARMGLTASQMSTVELINMDGGSGSLSGVSRSISTYSTETMTVEIDGFRVYGPTTNAAYKESLTVNGETVTEDGSEYDAIYYNALDAVNGTSIAAYIEGATGEYNVTEYEGLGGPQNEIYLAPGQSVAFAVSGTTPIQVSLRAVKTGVDATGASAYGVSANGVTIAHATEMYYTVYPSNDVVSITNTSSSGLLAIGNLKFSVSAEASTLQVLTAANYDAVFALLDAGGSEIGAPPVSDDVILMLDRQWVNDSGTQVSSLAGSSVTAVYSLENLTRRSLTVTLMTAAYDENGKMVGLQMETVSLASLAEVRLTSTLCLPAGTAEVKSFLLGEDMHPLCSADTLSVSGSAAIS